MALVLTAQLVVPVLLIALLAVGPRRPLAAGLALLATWLYLAGVARVGLWTSLPGWTSWAMASLAAIAALPAFRNARRGTAPSRATRIAASSAMLVFLSAATVGVAALREAALSRRLAPGPLAELAWPLEAGTYRVVNGGSRPMTNGHLRTLDPSVPRYRRWRGQSFGVDIVALDRHGLRATGWRPADPSAYAIFGRRVLAPCDGTVVATEANAPDMRVPQVDRARMLGNHVILRCGAFDVVMAHLGRGSLTVTRGDRVGTGHVLGRVGNSGNSDEPHLHLHAQQRGSPHAPVDAEPMPVRIEGRVPVRNDLRRAAQPAARRHRPEAAAHAPTG